MANVNLPEKQALIIRLTTCFLNQAVPTFDTVLEPMIYVRGDQEPITQLRAIYPFQDINPENTYDYCEILPYFSAEGFNYFIPVFLKYLINNDDFLDENIFSSFEYKMDDELNGTTINRFTKRAPALLDSDQYEIVMETLDWICENNPHKELTKEVLSKFQLFLDINREQVRT